MNEQFASNYTEYVSIVGRYTVNESMLSNFACLFDAKKVCLVADTVTKQKIIDDNVLVQYTASYDAVNHAMNIERAPLDYSDPEQKKKDPNGSLVSIQSTDQHNSKKENRSPWFHHRPIPVLVLP